MRKVLSSLALAFVASGGEELAAQRRSEPVLQPAARVDVLVARITAVQAGVEGSLAAGRYVRVGIVGAIGGSWHSGASGLSARSDVVGRFIVDPDFQSRWAPYAGAGIGARYDRIADWRAVVIAVLGVEGPDWSGMVPFIEAGYGGGTRVGLGLRRRRPSGR